VFFTSPGRKHAGNQCRLLIAEDSRDRNARDALASLRHRLRAGTHRLAAPRRECKRRQQTFHPIQCYKFRVWSARVGHVCHALPPGAPVKFQRRNVSIFPNSSSPPAALSRARDIFKQPTSFSPEQVSAAIPVSAEPVCPPLTAETSDVFATRVSCQQSHWQWLAVLRSQRTVVSADW